MMLLSAALPWNLFPVPSNLMGCQQVTTVSQRKSYDDLHT